MRVRAIRWNFLLGACIPVDSRPKPTILVGAFSIYSTQLTLSLTHSNQNVFMIYQPQELI